MNAFDRVHEAAAKLDENSTPDEVRAVVILYREAAWPDGRTLSPGTLAWFVGDFLPRWLPSAFLDPLDPPETTRFDSDTRA